MTTLLFGDKTPAYEDPGKRPQALARAPSAPFPPSPSFNPPTDSAPAALAPTVELEGVPPPSAAVARTAPLAEVQPAALANVDAPAPEAPVQTLPRPRPVSPAPSPWIGSRPVALPAMVLGIAAASVVFAGMAIFGVALAWHASMTRLAEVALMILGGYLISLGVAYVVAVSPDASART